MEKYLDDYIIENKQWIDENPYNEQAILLRTKLEKHANIAHMGCVVESSNEKSIIGTMALDTCYGIVFYDRQNKKGIVGHGAPSSKIATLQEMLNLLDKDKPLEIEFAFVPGFRNIDRKDYKGIMELQNYLLRHCPKNVKLMPFQSDLGVQLHEKTLSYEFAFDVNTGLPVSQYLFYDSTLDSKFYR